ncbi:MAG: hypothetical protein Sw2LagTSB_11600 [Shewanella algae]
MQVIDLQAAVAAVGRGDKFDIEHALAQNSTLLQLLPVSRQCQADGEGIPGIQRDKGVLFK